MTVPQTHLTQSLARYGFGERLLYAIEDFGSNIPAPFVDDWCNELADYFQRDPLGYIGNSYRMPPPVFPASFPDLSLANGFIHPVTSPSEVLLGHDWLLRMPDVPRILQYCIQHFSSPTGNIMFERFRRSINAGVAFRSLLQETVTQDEKSQVLTQVCLFYFLYDR